MHPRLVALRTTIEAWCAGRLWAPRALLLAWLAWIAGHHLADDAYQSLFGAITLGIHEAGHVIFRPFGDWLCSAGGTIAQCAAPVIAALVLVRQPDWFGVPLCAVWLADSLYGAALYCSDATAMALPLVTIGGGSGEAERMHDWHYLLDSVGMLGAESWLAPLIRLVGFVLAWGGIAAGAWMCWRMTLPAPPRPARSAAPLAPPRPPALRPPTPLPDALQPPSLLPPILPPPGPPPGQRR